MNPGPQGISSDAHTSLTVMSPAKGYYLHLFMLGDCKRAHSNFLIVIVDNQHPLLAHSDLDVLGELMSKFTVIVILAY